MEDNNDDNMQIEEEEPEGDIANNEVDARHTEDFKDESKANVLEDASSKNMDMSDSDTEQACPICMEQWNSSGAHRLCCLRCGHLFGHSCIMRWLQGSCTRENRRCPQCNKKATVKHVRMLYAKKLSAIDSSELDRVTTTLQSVTAENDRMKKELIRYDIRQQIYEQQIANMKSRIVELENQQLEYTNNLEQSTSRPVIRKFHFERSIDICNEGGCRVLDYNPWHKYLVASQKSNTTLFTGYGIKKIDSERFQSRQFIFLHAKVIRDVKFHCLQQTLLLSVSFDKCAKLLDIRNNIIVHTYHSESPLWSCCWATHNPNIFLVGAQNGLIKQFDIRHTTDTIGTLDGFGDRSPVVSLAAVPSNPGSGISRDGFIACRLNTCYVYECQSLNYFPMQVVLEGPFVAVCYDAVTNHALISSRPSARQAHARHTVCTIEKSDEQTVICNVVHTFQAGNSQQLLSRPCYVHTGDDTLIAAHQESTSSISLWSIASGRHLYSLAVSDPIMDLCSFSVNNDLFLATLSAKTLRLYKY